MPAHELYAAVSLAIVAICSGICLPFRSGTKVALHLPEHTVDATSLDPFDVVKPEDYVDGIPRDEDRFWTGMLWRKSWILVAMLFVVCMEAWLFARVIPYPNQLTSEFVARLLSLAFALYTLLLGAYSIWRNSSAAHATLVVHLSWLTTLACILLSYSAVFPSFPEPSCRAGPFGGRLCPQTFEHLILALYFVTACMAMTMPRGPVLTWFTSQVYDAKTLNTARDIEAPQEQDDSRPVSGALYESLWSRLVFGYVTRVLKHAAATGKLVITDLPIMPASSRATVMFSRMRVATRSYTWKRQRGTGRELLYRIVRLNLANWIVMGLLVVIGSVVYYAPKLFLKLLLAHLEIPYGERNAVRGWTYAAGLFASNVGSGLLFDQIFYLGEMVLTVRLRAQLNTMLFAKTLVRKDVASTNSAQENGQQDGNKGEQGDFQSKSQVMSLITSDVNRVAGLPDVYYAVLACPVEAVVGTWLLYDLIGVSCFVGLAVCVISIPLNRYIGKLGSKTFRNLAEARTRRVSLTNEALAAIRMLKFMAWERKLEARVMDARRQELGFQKMQNWMFLGLNTFWDVAPILITLISFWHFAIVRQQPLTPSIAFTSIAVLAELRFAINTIPQNYLRVMGVLVSLRRMDKYLQVPELRPSDGVRRPVAFRNATIAWPQDAKTLNDDTESPASPLHRNFALRDLSVEFPQGQLSLICGRLGSGKTLMLLGLLGEADVVSGQVSCPRSRPDALASLNSVTASKRDWIVEGTSAYVPQSAWLRNASIKENILFSLPYVEERYKRTLEACALLPDLRVLEDGDDSEIGEQGIGLSGGQKARVSLARAVYSRAAVILLDDVLSAVDAHTSEHLLSNCLRGELMKNRTIILASHHVHLVGPRANYIVALENGLVGFAGSFSDFQSSSLLGSLGHITDEKTDDMDNSLPPSSQANEQRLAVAPADVDKLKNTESGFNPSKKKPRKVVEEEEKATGRVRKDVWLFYAKAAGGLPQMLLLAFGVFSGALMPIVERWWLRLWSASTLDVADARSPIYYLGVYSGIRLLALGMGVLKWWIIYNGSVKASMVLYSSILQRILFAPMRFHDTVSRGRVLNRFGKDFDVIDSDLAGEFGQSVLVGAEIIAAFVLIAAVGGPWFLVAYLIGAVFYIRVAKTYNRAAPDLRRLGSTTQSPLYSIYGETISGVVVLRAFGASSYFMREMLRNVDANLVPYFNNVAAQHWLSVRLGLLSNSIVGLVGVAALQSPSMDAATAGFALSLISSSVGLLSSMVSNIASTEQAMVAVERVKEYTELRSEPSEFVEPRPARTWPSRGKIECENLVVRYAPDLPDVLHKITFEVQPGEKVGVLGRTGSGKSTLALSFFRFVEATNGRIVIDGVDISKIGLTDLRSKITIIPQDPIILSGTLRSTLDIFGDYTDADILAALRRVHLITSRSEGTPTAADALAETSNVNVFTNLDSPVSEGGDNFSAGEKQLLCMARALLKRSKVLIMDEATGSVDFATDQLIGKTIREEFADSTILTIAHRLRTIVDYDRVLVLDEGRVVEYDSPKVLLADDKSRFHAFCKATGKEELATLKEMAGAF